MIEYRRIQRITRHHRVTLAEWVRQTLGTACREEPDDDSGKKLAERASTIALGSPRLSARDAIHVAVMQHHDIARILSFDSAFDRVPGITRLG